MLQEEEGRSARARKKQRKAAQLDLFKTAKDPIPKWMSQCLEKVYPLVAERLDRAGCHEYIRSLGMPVPFPSNCMMCPSISKIELL